MGGDFQAGDAQAFPALHHLGIPLLESLLHWSGADARAFGTLLRVEFHKHTGRSVIHMGRRAERLRGKGVPLLLQAVVGSL
jgi:hypothetical protein